MYFNVLVCEKSQGMGYNGHIAQRTNGEPFLNSHLTCEKRVSHHLIKLDWGLKVKQ